MTKFAKGCKRLLENVVHPGFPSLLQTFAVFCKNHVLLQSFCLIYVSVLIIFQYPLVKKIMPFFETMNNALRMVWQLASKITCTSNVYYQFILFLEHNSRSIRSFICTQNRGYSGLSTYQVVGDTLGSETTEGNSRPRVETACEYSCVRGLGGASRLTERVAPPALREGQTTRASKIEYTRLRVGRLLPSRVLPRQFTN